MSTPAMTLTDEQLNIAICEWRGFCVAQKEQWTHTRFYVEYNDDDEFTCNHCGAKQFRPGHILPSHILGPEALGNMHEAEKGLVGKQCTDYESELQDQRLFSGKVEPSQYLWHATARQRAIALLRGVKPEIFQ